jgi:hypothetical protein
VNDGHLPIFISARVQKSVRDHHAPGNKSACRYQIHPLRQLSAELCDRCIRA